MIKKDGCKCRKRLQRTPLPLFCCIYTNRKPWAELLGVNKINFGWKYKLTYVHGVEEYPTALPLVVTTPRDIPLDKGSKIRGSRQ